MSKALSFENVGKLYNLGVVGTGMFTNDVYRWFKTAILRQEDPYLKVGEVNDRSKAGESKFVWALKDITFDVEEGDMVGIIGKNGAGKSTLLKLLSRVTGPTIGTIKAKGRIGSLLEVGTGFHPELTGRENIYMNGAILGMTKREINSKLDEIIDFSGCERYIDTPVKRYSSGMMVRLGFAVAAHLEPEILVVDEVLAVGDAEFQKKAIGKMQDVSRGEGRTVLFVSHNMGSVRNLCKKGILLKDGMIEYIGKVDDVVDKYLTIGKIGNDICYREYNESIKRDEGLALDMCFLSARLCKGKNHFATDEPLEFEFVVKANRSVDSFRLNTTVFTLDDVPVGSVSGADFFSIQSGEKKTIGLTIHRHRLAMGEYKVSFSLGTGDFSTGQRDFQIITDVFSFYIDRVSKDAESYVEWHKTWGNVMYEAEITIR